jgi:starch synthase
MDIVLVAPEIAPYSKTLSAAEQVAALSKALRTLGHKVTVILPLWASIDPGSRHLGRRLTKIEVDSDGTPVRLSLHEGRTSGGVDLLFLSTEEHFGPGVTASDESEGTSQRWGLFLRGAMELLRRRESRPDVVHVHEWQTAPLALMLREDRELGSLPVVLTISSMDSVGRFERHALGHFGLPASLFSIEGVEFFGKFSALKAGLVAAARIVTPGPSFLRSFLERGGGGGLEGVLKSREGALVGIVPGVDASVFNSATDPHLTTRFDAMDVAGTGTFGKSRCKAALQQELGLPVSGGVALAVVLGGSGPRSGLDRLAEIVPSIARNDLQLAVLVDDAGSTATSRLMELAARFPDRLAVRLGMGPTDDHALAHRALGAADLAIVTALDDPRTTLQMEAHRYGTLPIGRRNGLFADTVVDCDAQLRSGDGFSFEEATSEALLGAIQRAIAGFALGAPFRAAQLRAIGADHGWERPARLHERIFRQASAASQAAITAAAAATT